MKLTVAGPLVALIPALILALLTLLAGISPTFMPETYIVQIMAKNQGANSTDPATNVTDPATNGTKAGKGRCLVKSNRGCLYRESHPVPIQAPSMSPNTTGLNPQSISCSLHYLTNCLSRVNNTTEECSKPWDFLTCWDLLTYSTGNDTPSTKHVAYKLKRDAAPTNLSSEFAGSDAEMEKVRKVRHAFSIVHLTACVLIGISLVCTAASFLFLPALGQWITVANLAIVTLATIFLLISSIFTAVLAKKLTEFVAQHKLASRMFTAESGQKFQSLI